MKPLKYRYRRTSLLRAAAKNYQDVTVVIGPCSYPVIMNELKENNGEISLKTKKKLAVEVFEHTAFYDAMISKYLRKNMVEEEVLFPVNLNMFTKKKMDLRYGENPHQSASFYREPLSMKPIWEMPYNWVARNSHSIIWLT